MCDLGALRLGGRRIHRPDAAPGNAHLWRRGAVAVERRTFRQRGTEMGQIEFQALFKATFSSIGLAKTCAKRPSVRISLASRSLPEKLTLAPARALT